MKKGGHHGNVQKVIFVWVQKIFVSKVANVINLAPTDNTANFLDNTKLGKYVSHTPPVDLYWFFEISIWAFISN